MKRTSRATVLLLERLARAGELDALGAPLLRLTDAVELTRAALGRTAA